MRCPSCQHESPAPANFCPECGAALGRACAACGTPLSPLDNFCHACGESTSGSGGPDRVRRADGERRQLTVLFCDLVTFTELGERMDLEDLQEVLHGYHETAAGIVERYHGHVAQYLGDGLLVYFGYPVAHEDDPERAVRTGLEILQRLGAAEIETESEAVRLSARIGVHTGPVVVGEIGGGAGASHLALGGTTNIAARLQELAGPDELVVSATTLRLTRGGFATEPLGEHLLKGIATPIELHRVLGPSGVRVGLEASPEPLTPFVGRRLELGLLLDRWDRALGGEGQAVWITGEAGIGKSRLAAALREELRDRAHGWLECRCSPYAQSTAFGPLIDLLRQGLGFREGDPPSRRLALLEEALADIGLPREETLPLLAVLLSIDPGADHPVLSWSPERRRGRTLEALVGWCLALAGSQPLVVVIEDLQWSDPSTLELIGLLVEQTATARTLLVLSSRPDFRPPWSPRSNLTPLSLSRLTRRQATEMVASLCADGELPDAAHEAVVDRADGIPLYVEELTKGVLDSGLLVRRDGRWELAGNVAHLEVPETLQDSLMARLDRLSSAKEVAQMAAAIGRDFSYELLREVSGLEEDVLRHGLARLVESELLFQRGTPPNAAYTFKHALIQDTAYASMLRSVRQELHAAIARVLEASADRVEPALLAHHYALAGRTEEASLHHQRAGEEALARSANAEAETNLRAALEELRSLPEEAGRDERELALQISLGAAMAASRGYAHGSVRPVFERARVLCSRVGDPPHLASALAGLGAFYVSVSEFDTAIGLAEQLLEVARASGDPAQHVAGLVSLGLPKFYQGRFAESLEHLDEARGLYDGDRHAPARWTLSTDQWVTASGFSALDLWALGRGDAADERAAAMVEHARRLEHPFSLGFGLMLATVLRLWRREWALADRLTREGAELAATYGFPLLEGAAAVAGAMARAAGEGRDTFEEATAGAVRAASTGNQVGASLWLWCLARIQQEMGRIGAARALVASALEASARAGQPFWDAELLGVEGELAAAGEPPDPETATRCFERALALARRQGARGHELRAATRLVRHRRSLGRPDGADDLLAPLCASFGEGLDTLDLKDAKALLA